MTTMKPWRVDEQYEVRQLADSEFIPVWMAMLPRVFDYWFRLDDAYGAAEKQRLAELSANLRGAHALNLGVFHGEVMVGWSRSVQHTVDGLLMKNSAIVPEHQGRGLYKHLLQIVIDHAREQGFQIISSAHNASNNRVIIPKLKRGFVITGFDLEERFGLLVKLSYFLDDTRREVMAWRSGYRPLPEHLKRHLGGQGGGSERG